MTVVSVIDQDVRGEGREAGGHLPNMKIMYVQHARYVVQITVDDCHIHATRSGLKEDPPGVPDKPPARLDHQPGHYEGGHGVGLGPARD